MLRNAPTRALVAVVVAALCAAPSLFAQSQGSSSSSSSSSTQQQQSVPDAPTPNRPVPEFPANAPPEPKVPVRAPAPAPENAAPAGTAPAAPAYQGPSSPIIHVSVNLVVIPVTVKDSAGHLVPGLTAPDFTVLENGVPQRLTFFSSDPFPLSVAVVLDHNLPELTMRKVRETLPALLGAFSEYDEAGVFSYGNTVKEQVGFTASSEQLNAALRRSESQGRTDGPPVESGPMMGMSTPSVNGHPFNPGTPHVLVTRKESSVLNDAILAAANSLAKRDRSRRKIIFVISDGREDGSDASYSDVLKVLLSNNVSVYALAVDAAAIPGYSTLESIHLPFMGYGNILGKYVSATGGEIFAEFTQQSIEGAYDRITNQARNQYTLGYAAQAGASDSYRSIEVRVHRPDLLVRAKDGYYPLPPAR